MAENHLAQGEDCVFAVDVGNTNIVAAAFAGEKIVKKWRLQTDINRSERQYLDDFQTFFAEDGFCAENWKNAVLSSVVPCLLPIFQNVFSHICGKPPKVLCRQVFGSLPVFVSPEFEREIGTDLVANAAEVFCAEGKAAVAVDFGTALTFASVGEKCEIAGVAIAPGLDPAARALCDNAAQLPEIPLAAPKSALGRNTTDAIQAGIVLGYEGLVANVIERTKSDLRQNRGVQGEISVVATGGLCEVLHFKKGLFSRIDRNLTLKGLRRIFYSI